MQYGATTMPQLSMHTPVGEVTITEEDGAIVAVDWGRGRDQQPTPLLRRACAQLEAYFDGTRTDFDLPLEPKGSKFQHAVWKAMIGIPAGETRTYGEVAAAIGGTARAVGGACGANPIPIIIPCHRIVAASHLGGYSGQGGLDTKQALLRLEGWQPKRGSIGDLFEARA
jgi:methylated-DNA-[protein]-cysteine S-methyltransferase